MEQKKKGLSLRRRFGNVLRDIDLSKVRKGTWQIPNTRCLVSLGEGAFGPMNICENRVTGQIALEKVVRKDEAILGHLKEEIRCLTLCKSAPEILNMTAFSDSLRSYQLYLERFNSVPLNRLNANRMCPWILGSILKSTGKALRFIHSKGIVHRQLTGQNILVSPTLEVKITGFDVATVGNKLYGSVGVLGYMAPEVVAHSYRYIQVKTGYNDYDRIVNFSNACPAYNHSVDYYTLGETVFEMFFDRPPAFIDLEIIKEEYIEDAILFNMIEGDPIFPDHELEAPETFKVFERLLGNLLQKDPVKRCVDNKFKKNKVFREVIKQKPKKATAVNLESFVKDYNHETAALAKLWYDPSLQFGRGGNLKDIFFYLTTRPSSHLRWKLEMNTFYPDRYDEYISYWNEIRRGPAVEAMVEEIENVPQEPSVQTSEVFGSSVVSMNTDVTEVELEPDFDDFLVNEIVAFQEGDESEDSGSAHSAVGEKEDTSKPKKATAVDLESFVKDYNAETAALAKLSHDRSLKFGRGRDRKYIFFYLTPRPLSHRRWELVKKSSYPDHYDEYIADGNEVQSGPAVEAPVEEIENVPQESSGETAEVTTEIVGDHYSVVSMHADVKEEGLVPDVDALPINEIVAVQEGDENEDSGSTHSAVGEKEDTSSESFFTSQSGALSTPTFVSTSQESPEPISEETISTILSDTEEVLLHAAVEPVQVGDTGDEGLDDDDFITCVILWIAFVILCLFFLGKSVFNICTRSGQSKDSTDHGDEGGIDHGDSPGKGDDLGTHADDIEDHGDVFGQDGEDFGDHVDDLADSGDSPDPGDL